MAGISAVCRMTANTGQGFHQGCTERNDVDKTLDTIIGEDARKDVPVLVDLLACRHVRLGQWHLQKNDSNRGCAHSIPPAKGSRTPDHRKQLLPLEFIQSERSLPALAEQAVCSDNNVKLRLVPLPLDIVSTFTTVTSPDPARLACG
jgi:hypothetical protein